MDEFKPDFSLPNWDNENSDFSYKKQEELPKFKIYKVGNKEYKVDIDTYYKAMSEGRTHVVLLDNVIVFMDDKDFEAEKRRKSLYVKHTSNNYHRNFNRGRR